MATGYKINGVDISELAMQDYGSTQCPTISLGVTGFSTNAKTTPVTDITNNRFWATDSSDPWKQPSNITKNYYKSDKSYSDSDLKNADIATIESCPNFKKIIGFYGGDVAAPHSTAKKIFEAGKTYRIHVYRADDDSSIFIRIRDNAADGVFFNQRYELKPQNNKLPTALIVGIQAAGGDGSESQYTRPGSGGGAGACCYVVLDWNKAKEKLDSIKNKYINSLVFQFSITPIENWKTIAYPSDRTKKTCSNNCVAVNLCGFSTGSRGESIKSKLIVGCGQDAYDIYAGNAGVVKNYDLGDAILNSDANPKTYTDAELAEFGIHILNMHVSGTTDGNGGFGGVVSADGYSSTRYWLCPTNHSITGDFGYIAGPNYEQLYVHSGGISAPGCAGGGGASCFADGGTSAMLDTSSSTGRLGSGGGGGGYYNEYYNAGLGGLPYIFFCSNIDFTVTKVAFACCTITRDISYSAALNSTYIAYLHETGNPNNRVYIYPNTLNVAYPDGCDKSNTSVCLNTSGYWNSVKMSDTELNTAYLTCQSMVSSTHWGYNIKFISM